MTFILNSPKNPYHPPLLSLKFTVFKDMSFIIMSFIIMSFIIMSLNNVFRGYEIINKIKWLSHLKFYIYSIIFLYLYTKSIDLYVNGIDLYTKSIDLYVNGIDLYDFLKKKFIFLEYPQTTI